MSKPDWDITSANSDANRRSFATTIQTSLEILRHERFYAESILYFILCLRGRANDRLEHTSRLKSESPHHVYELRLYHPHEGKLDALKARFGDHTDAIFRRHNMKSIGYWSPEDAPDSQNLFIYILEHPSRQEAGKNWAAFQTDSE